MPVPVALVATAAVTVGAFGALRAVRRAVLRGERPLREAAGDGRRGERDGPQGEDVYDLHHDPETNTYRASVEGSDRR